MCVEISNQQQQQQFNKREMKGTKKVSYSIKKLFWQLFKQQQKSSKSMMTLQKLLATKKSTSLESVESLENIYNANKEIEECTSLESCENDINERLSAQAATFEMEDFDFSEISANVPVHFVRTEHGTFFWTATSDIAADNDLIEPLYCDTHNQLPAMEDRWAQA